jgi:hypothetical protein
MQKIVLALALASAQTKRVSAGLGLATTSSGDAGR